MHNNIAFKISSYLLNYIYDEYSSIPFIMKIIFTRLGDLPVIFSMINNLGSKDFFNFFSEDERQYEHFIKNMLQFPEIINKKITNQIEIKDGTILSFTDFQSKIFKLLVEGKNVTFSAPTSGGKSYIVQNYIAYKLYEKKRYTTIYIAPTKALIGEIQSSIREKIKNLGIEPFDVKVTTSISNFNLEDIELYEKRVIILTQERMQEIIADKIDIIIDLLIVDEAQRIRDETRGIILEDTVQELISLHPNIQKIILSPYISNPGRFRTIFNIKDPIDVATTSRTPVIQNIILVNIKKKYAKTAILLPEMQEIDEQVSNVLKLEEYDVSKEKLTSRTKKKVWVINNLINPEDPTIVYCDRPFDCRDVAQKLIEKDKDSEKSDKIDEIINFLRGIIHEEYYLCDILEYKIGYHYGRMPQFVRFIVKKLFEEKELNIICCTSTLLAGVNLPAKNIVLHTPKAGKQLDRLSLLNLAGRAGRLLKDFYGNIYCIDIKDWETGEDVFNNSLEEIKSVSEEIVEKELHDLIEYLKDKKYACSQNVKGLATSLIMKQIRTSNSSFLSDLGKRCTNLSEEDQVIIKQLLIKIISEISDLPKEVILRNRTFDPRNQYELYLKIKNLENINLIPYPEDYNKDGIAFYYKILPVFKLISKYLFQLDNMRYKYFAFLASLWIMETPYKAILERKIARAIKYKKEKETYKSFINKMIDNLDGELETNIKFEYNRASRCYIDIITQVMEEREVEVSICKEFPSLLEAGASHSNTLFLLEMGLSRTTATIISKHIGIQLLGTYPTFIWLKTNIIFLQRILKRISYQELIMILNNYEKKEVEDHFK